jgi:hypothetical protein
MKLTLRFLAVGLLLGPLAGCSDSPDMLFHDLAVFWNEIADVMLSVNDEESAKRALAANLKRYKARTDELKVRIVNNTDPPNGKLNKTEKEDYNGAFVDYYDEIYATSQRLLHAMQRLDALISSIKASGGAVDKLTEVRNLPCTLNINKNEVAPGFFIVAPDKTKGQMANVGPGLGLPCGGGGAPGGGGGFGRPGGGGGFGGKGGTAR